MKQYIFRGLGYILNVLIIITPTFWLADHMYFAYRELVNLQDITGYAALASIDLAIYIAFPSRIFIHAITKAVSISGIFMFGFPVAISYTFLDSIIAYTLKGDIGKKIFKLSIVSNNHKKAKFSQIIIRCIIKYFTLAFAPFCLLYPIFNKERLMLHDKISKTKVVKTYK